MTIAAARTRRRIMREYCDGTVVLDGWCVGANGTIAAPWLRVVVGCDQNGFAGRRLRLVDAGHLIGAVKRRWLCRCRRRTAAIGSGGVFGIGFVLYLDTGMTVVLLVVGDVRQVVALLLVVVGHPLPEMGWQCEWEYGANYMIGRRLDGTQSVEWRTKVDVKNMMTRGRN